MNYILIFFSAFILSGCSAFDRTSTNSPSQKSGATEKIKIDREGRIYNPKIAFPTKGAYRSDVNNFPKFYYP